MDEGGGFLEWGRACPSEDLKGKPARSTENETEEKDHHCLVGHRMECRLCFMIERKPLKSFLSKGVP